MKRTSRSRRAVPMALVMLLVALATVVLGSSAHPPKADAYPHPIPFYPAAIGVNTMHPMSAGFSGSHQDAIKKGFAALTHPTDYPVWEVPYLPIDPMHVGRTYEAVIRVNSQSGKGGVAYIMESEHGMILPRRLQIEFSKTIQGITEDTGTEISPSAMWQSFQDEYLPEKPTIELLTHETATSKTETGDRAKVTAQLLVDGQFAGYRRSHRQMKPDGIFERFEVRRSETAERLH